MQAEAAERAAKRAAEQKKMAQLKEDKEKAKQGDTKPISPVQPEKAAPAKGVNKALLGPSAGGDNTAIVDKVIGNLASKDAKELAKAVQERRNAAKVPDQKQGLRTIPSTVHCIQLFSLLPSLTVCCLVC